MMHMDRIFIAKNGTKVGEYSTQEVLDMLRSGVLIPSDSYWREGMLDWSDAGELLTAPLPAPETKTSWVTSIHRCAAHSKELGFSQQHDLLLSLGTMAVLVVYVSDVVARGCWL